MLMMMTMMMLIVVVMVYKNAEFPQACGTCALNGHYEDIQNAKTPQLHDTSSID